MILKRNFNPIRVFQYVKHEMLFAMIIAAGVYLLHRATLNLPAIPFAVVAILGSALAIFIAFRNNNAYNRWWEARTLWGGIINSSRIFSRLIITFTDSHRHQAGYHAERSETFKKTLVYITIAWAHSLRIHLRREQHWSSVLPFIPEKYHTAFLSAQHKPNYLHLITGTLIYEAMANSTLGGFDSFQLEGQLAALDNYQGGCERIKNTPLLRQYDYFTRVFLYTFMLMLPLSMLHEFDKLSLAYMTVPVSLIISFVFAIISKVGEVNEDPFENRITDVPLTSLCNTIERDLREMLGEKELPEKTEVKDGFIF